MCAPVKVLSYCTVFHSSLLSTPTSNLYYYYPPKTYQRCLPYPSIVPVSKSANVKKKKTRVLALVSTIRASSTTRRSRAIILTTKSVCQKKSVRSHARIRSSSPTHLRSLLRACQNEGIRIKNSSIIKDTP